MFGQMCLNIVAEVYFRSEDCSYINRASLVGVGILIAAGSLIGEPAEMVDLRPLRRLCGGHHFAL